MGPKPIPRLGHAAHHIEELSFIVFYGGKNDEQEEIHYYNDIFLLNLENLNWVQVDVKGNCPRRRAYLCSAVYGIFFSHKLDSKMIVFGGLNLKGYVGSNVNVLELGNFPLLTVDSQLAHKLNEKYKENEKKYNNSEALGE